MKLIPALCTQCHAALSVDDTKDAIICPYCGKPFIVEKGIAAFNNKYIQKTAINADKEILNEPVIEGDFDIRDHVLVKYLGHSKEVVIPDGVERIEDGALDGALYRLDKLVIPGTVKKLFYKTTQRSVFIKELILNEGVEEFFGICCPGDPLRFIPYSQTIGKLILPSSIKKINLPAIVADIKEHKEGKNFTYYTNTYIDISCPNGKSEAVQQLERYLMRRCIYCGGQGVRLFSSKCKVCGRYHRLIPPFKIVKENRPNFSDKWYFPMENKRR